MKKQVIYILAVLALVLMASSPAFADIADPQIIVRGGGTSGTITLTPGNTSTTVFFDTDPRCHQFVGSIGGVPAPAMDCPVFNATGTSLYSFTWIISPPQLPLTFSNTGVAGSFTLDPTGTILTFYFATPFTTGNDLNIDFVNFAPGTPIDFIAQTPEPGTMGLFFAGASALVARLRRRKVAA